MNASTAVGGLPYVLNASLLNAPPDVDLEGVQRFVKVHYGIIGHVQPLSGERDRTFHISGQKGIDYVFKVAHPDEDPETTNLQIEVLLFLARYRSLAADAARHSMSRRGASGALSFAQRRFIKRQACVLYSR